MSPGIMECSVFATSNGESGTSYLDGKNDVEIDRRNKLPMISLRPLERNMANILASPNLQGSQVKKIAVPSPSPPQGKVITLNAPFIKFSSEPRPKRGNQDQNNEAAHSLPSGAQVARTSQPHSSPKNKLRVAPSRSCKNRPPQSPSASVTSDDTDRSDKDYRPRRVNRRSRGTNRLPIRPGNRISRAYLRVLDKIRKKAAKKLRSEYPRVNRTVELVNQSKDSWRNESEKLVFMLSLGLFPKTIRAVPQLRVHLTRPDPAVIAKIEERYERERVIRLAKERAQRQAARKRFLELRQQRSFRAAAEQRPIECIDLASDEDEADNSIESFILPNYPNIIVNTQVAPKPKPIPPLKLIRRNEAFALTSPKVTITSITTPRVVRRLEPVKVDEIKSKAGPLPKLLPYHHYPENIGVKNFGHQRPTNPLKGTYPHQQIGMNKSKTQQVRFPMKKRVPVQQLHVYVEPSPPMNLGVEDLAPVAKIMERLKSQNNHLSRQCENPVTIQMLQQPVLPACDEDEEVIILD